MSKTKYTKLFLFCLIPIILTGCWDSIEINNRSVILEFAIDKNENVDEWLPISQRERFKLTYSIPDMAKMSGTDSLTEDVKTVVDIKAPTLVDSIKRLETRTRNTVSFSHVKAVLFGEELLKDKELFREVLDSTTRNMLLARNVPILAVQGKAGEQVKVENKQQPIVGLYVMSFYNNKERAKSAFKPELMGNFIREMEDTGIATMPIFRSNKEGEIDIGGGAVMKDYALVDYLSKEEVKGLMYIQGKIKGATVLVNYHGEYVTYVIKNETSKIHFKQNGTAVEGYVDLELEGNIVEYISSKEKNLFLKSNIEEIETLLEKQVVEEASKAVMKSKDLNVDFLGIGVEIYRKDPKLWRALESNWRVNGYRDFPIHLNANINIKNTGVLQ